MARQYIFADETGNLDFSRNQGASRYFALGSILTDETGIGEELLRLKRELAWRGLALESAFHASQDPVAVREAVFGLLRTLNFRIDMTLFDKPKTRPDLMRDEERLYKTLAFLHFKYVIPRVIRASDELMVVVATIGTKRRRRAYRLALEDVIHQVSPTHSWRLAFWPCQSDPCLQAADYCAWGLQRKHEAGDSRWSDYIQDKVASEYDVFRGSSITYY